ncbi:MAG: glycosyltransferase [Pseudomonadota bacterium]
MENLVRQWCECELSVKIVAPISLANHLKSIQYKKDKSLSLLGINKIYRPKYLTFSNKKVGSFDLSSISQNNFVKSANKVLMNDGDHEVFYGKFLFSGAYSAALAGKKYNLPSFGDIGESISFQSLTKERRKLAKWIIQELTGIVCVSPRLRDEIIELGASPEKILLAPNEADPKRFKKLDRTECRRSLNLPIDAKIVAFTGHFIERKGPLRLLKALDQLDNVYGIFMGRGKQVPIGEKVLHAGPVSNSRLPVWLNASDVFVLPTLSEGSCNAVAEALACGLPVITSDIDDMTSQFRDQKVSFINPHDPTQIANYIMKSFEDDSLSCNDEKKKDIDRQTRGAEIATWIGNQIMK